MNLPNPLRSDEWSQPIRIVAWATLASVALVAIMAGLGVVTSIISAQGPLLYALAGGWLLASLADACEGWKRIDHATHPSAAVSLEGARSNLARGAGFELGEHMLKAAALNRRVSKHPV